MHSVISVVFGSNHMWTFKMFYPLVFCVSLFEVCNCFAVGITPEQIYQQNIDWGAILGTWEKLPEINPLAEKSLGRPENGFRTLITLRKDGTCRVFNAVNPSGVDGTWIAENHNISISLPGTVQVEFFVYGIKNDFMVTRSSLKNGVDQLWSRVK